MINRDGELRLHSSAFLIKFKVYGSAMPCFYFPCQYHEFLLDSQDVMLLLSQTLQRIKIKARIDIDSPTSDTSVGFQY